MSQNGQSADATKSIHAGEDRHGQSTSLTTPIAQTSVFILPSLEELNKLNTPGLSDAYSYTRWGNPTVRAAEEKLASLEEAEDCVVTSSGQAALLCAVLATCSADDEVVSMLDIYGGTLKLFEQVFARFGLKFTFVPLAELASIEQHFTPKTKLLFLETPTNPTLRCADIAALSAKAKRHNVLTMVDNTFASPILQKPLKLGADLVMHSATKYLGGHSDVTAGGLCGSKELIATARQMMILSGGCLDPGAAYLLIRGMKTLNIRVAKASENASVIASALAKNKAVERVFYPGLSDNESHAIASKQMSGFGSMVSFDIRGGLNAAEQFVQALKLWYLAPSLGGVESTISYPYYSSHVGLSEERLKLFGVSQSTIRCSVGIEAAADLVADLEQALQASQR